jgi:predicted TPR repeat methyltransferase/Flp pilus assembly protein TadD
MQIELPQAAEIGAALSGWRAANPVVDRMCIRYPEPHDALRHLGLSLLLQEKIDPAVGFLKAALALAPQEAALWNDLAGTFYRAGRQEEARAAQRISLDLNLAQPHGWLLLASVESNLGEDAAAESDYLTALRLDPHLAEAAFGLGLICFQRRRFAESVKWLRRSIADGGHNMGLYVCLGQALFLLGNFGEAVIALATAVRFPECDGAVVEKLAQLRLIETCVRDNAESAVTVYREIAGAHARDADAVTLTAFQFLSGFGYREAAIKLGEWRLARNPDDAMQTYLLAALRSEALARAPDNYLVAYFDEFADTFESKLVDALGYRVPEKLHAMLTNGGRRFANVLDLGCGTGLCAPFLLQFGDRLTGVDLSRRMLEKASARALYDDLIEAEAADFLDHCTDRFDLVVAADFIPYFGDLAALFEKVARVLKPGGLFAFNTETTECDFRILPSGRFAHAINYINVAAATNFTLADLEHTMIRLEAAKPVDGVLVVLQRV